METTKTVDHYKKRVIDRLEHQLAKQVKKVRAAEHVLNSERGHEMRIRESLVKLKGV